MVINLDPMIVSGKLSLSEIRFKIDAAMCGLKKPKQFDAKISEYDQEIQQSQIADKPVAS